jgi:hypothetical protein
MRRYRIGRAATNDIVVPDPTVSREHAELTLLDDGRLSIKDLGSTYGVEILKGTEWTAVQEAEVAPETRVCLGEVEMSVADLLRDADKTHVPGTAPIAPPRTMPPPRSPTASQAPAAQAPAPAPAPPKAPRTAAPTEVPAAPPGAPPAEPPPPPRAPRTAAPTEVPPAPSSVPPPRAPRTAAPTEVPDAAPAPRPAAPRPAPPRAPGAPAWGAMPKEKRVLLMLAGGFGAFLLIALIVLAVVLATG